MKQSLKYWLLAVGLFLAVLAFFGLADRYPVPTFVVVAVSVAVGLLRLTIGWIAHDRKRAKGRGGE